MSNVYVCRKKVFQSAIFWHFFFHFFLFLFLCLKCVCVCVRVLCVWICVWVWPETSIFEEVRLWCGPFWILYFSICITAAAESNSKNFAPNCRRSPIPFQSEFSQVVNFRLFIFILWQRKKPLWEQPWTPLFKTTSVKPKLTALFFLHFTSFVLFDFRQRLIFSWCIIHIFIIIVFCTYATFLFSSLSSLYLIFYCFLLLYFFLFLHF